MKQKEGNGKKKVYGQRMEGGKEAMASESGEA